MALSAATAFAGFAASSRADTFGNLWATDGNLTTLNSPTAWTNESAGPDVAPPGANDIAQFDAGTGLTAATTFTLGASTSWLGLSIVSPGAAVTIGGTGDTSNTLTIGADGINMSAATQNLTIADPLNLSVSQTVNVATAVTFTNSTTTTLGGNLTVAGAGNETFTGVITGTSDSINMSGTGTLTLTAANNIGGLTVNSGTAILGTASASAGTSSSAGPSTSTITLNGGSLRFTGSASGASGYYNPIFVESASGIASGGQLAGNITGSGQLNVTIGSSSTLSLMANSGMLSGYNGLIEMGTSAGTLRFNGVSGGTTYGIDLGTASASVNNRTAGTITIGSVAGGAGTFLVGSTSTNAATTYVVGGLGASTVMAGTIENGTDGSSATTVINLTGGTFTVTGNNTYTGGTTISAGTLQVGNNTTSGTMGTGAVTDSSVLIFNRSDNTYSAANAISGGGSFINNGTGTVSMTGTNTFTGGATLNAGLLQVENTTSALGTGTVNVNNTAGLGGIGNATAPVNVASGGIISPGDVGVNHGLGVGVGTFSLSSLTLNPGSILNYDFNGTAGNDLVNITGSNGLTVSGGGINLYSAGTTNPYETNGTYDIFQLTSPYSGSVTNLLSILNAQNGLTYTWGTSGDDITLAIAGGLVSTIWNVNASGTWAVAGNWTSGSPNGAGTSATFGSVATSPVTVTLNASETVGNLVFNDASGGASATYTLSSASGGGLVLDNGSGAANLTVSSGNQAISAPVTLNSNVSVAIASSSSTLAISGAIGGVGGITETGSGVLLMSGSNTYSGGTTISSGTLQVGTGGATGSFGTSTAAITDNGSLIYDLSSSLTVANVISGSGSLTQAGGGTLTLTASNTYSGTTHINAGTLQYGTGDPSALSGGKIAFGGPGVLDVNGNSVSLSSLSGTSGTIDNVNAGGTPTLTINSGSNQTFTGTIQNSSGTLALSKLGSGTLFLGGSNTYAGGTTIGASGSASGALKATSSAALGTGTVVIWPANGLQLATGVTISNPIVLDTGSTEFEDVPDSGASATIASAITLGSGASSQQLRIGTTPTSGGVPTSTLTLTGAATITDTDDCIITRGNIVYAQSGSITSQGLIVIGRQATSAQVNFTVQDNANVSGVGIDIGGLNSSSDDPIVSVTVTGNGTLNSGTGAMDIDDFWNSANSTVASEATLQITMSSNATMAAASFSDTSTTSFPTWNINGGTLKANASDASATSVWMPNMAALTVSLNGPVNVNNGGFSVTMAESFPGGGSFNFQGTGTTIIAAPNSYSGGDTLSAGTLVIADNSGTALGNGNVTLNGGTLASAATGGTLNGNVLAGSGAHTIAPGGIGTVGTLTLNGGLTTSSLTTLSFALGSGSGVVTADSVLILGSGTVSIGSGTQISVTGTPVAGDDYRIIGGSISSVESSESSIILPTVGSIGFVFNNTVDSGFIDLQAISVGPPNLTWNDASADNTWNLTSSDWNNGSGNATYSNGANVTFNDSNGGNYNVTLNTSVTPASVTVNSSAGNYTISGTGAITGTTALVKGGGSNLTLSTVNSYTGGTTVNLGTLVVGVNGALPAAGAVTISNGTVQLATSTGLATVTALSITGNGTFDVNNNHLIINYGSNADPIASIAALLKTGYNGGTWNGAGGIVSTAAATNHLSYGLGYADSADTGNPASLSAGTIEVKYTLLGDTNLDGVVNAVDFGILAANFNKGVTGWDKGDFNFDNVVSAIDFGELAANFNKGATGTSIGLPAIDDPAIVQFAQANGLMAELTTVPEPTSVGLLAVGAVGLMVRRRRSRN